MNATPLLILAAVAVLALAGCRVTQDYRPPEVTMPAGWSGSQQGAGAVAAADFPWWRTFNDPQLDSLVERALAANMDLQLAGARLLEARARGGSAGSRWSVGATASYARERESENAPSPVLVRRNGEVESPGRSENLFQAGFDASWELDFFGGTRRGTEAAQAEFESSGYQRGAVVLTLIAEVARTYIEVRGAQQQRRIARQTLTGQRETLTLLQERYAAGMAAGLDVARAQAQSQRSAAQLPALEADYQKGVHRLAVLLGQPPGTLDTELGRERPLAPPAVQPKLGLPSDLLRQRPDIRGAERTVAAASARLGVATTELYPKFFLLGRAGLASVGAGDFFNADSAFWSVGPSISWPILQGGRIKAMIEVRDAQLQQALISYRRAILNAIEDVENALTQYREDEVRRANLVQALRSEQQSYELYEDRYAAGLADLRGVLEAQGSMYQAQSELARCETALLLDLVSMYKAVGGGWNVPVPAGREQAQQDKEGGW